MSLVENETLRAVINIGGTRGTVVSYAVSATTRPRIFPTFCPKALGMKGKRLPDTTLTRSIVIEMKRKRAVD